MMYGEGISRTGEVLDIAVDLDVVKKGGSWFSYGDRKLGQGRDNVKELLKNEPELMKEIEQKILEKKAEEKESGGGKKKKGKAADAAESANAEGDVVDVENENEEVNSAEEDIFDNIDEDFEEFTPAD